MEILSVIVLIMMIAAYFAPMIVAIASDHKNTASISVVNVLLGWTLIGWVVALAWAFKKD